MLKNKQNVIYNNYVERINSFAKWRGLELQNHKKRKSCFSILFKGFVRGPDHAKVYDLIAAVSSIWKELDKKKRLERMRECVDDVVEPIELMELERKQRERDDDDYVPYKEKVGWF